MELMNIIKSEPLIIIYLGILFAGFFSKRAYISSYVFLAYLGLRDITGKTTTFNLNIVMTLTVAVSLAGNVWQYYKNKKLKGEGGEKNEYRS